MDNNNLTDNNLTDQDNTQLCTKKSLKQICDQIVNNNYQEVYGFIMSKYKVDEIRDIFKLIINYFIRYHRILKQRMILWKIIIDDPLLTMIMGNTVLFYPKHSRNIVNTFFSAYSELLPSDIPIIAQLFEPLFDNILTSSQIITLLETYGKRYYHKSSIYSVVYNIEEIQYINDENNKKSALYTILILKLYAKYPHVIELEELAIKLVDYTIIDGIEELELRKFELDTINKLIYSDTDISLKNSKDVLEKRIKLLNNLNHLFITNDIKLFFDKSIETIVLNCDYTNEELLISYITYKLHIKTIDILDRRDMLLMNNIISKKFNITNIYLLEKNIELLKYHLFNEKKYFNYNQELVIKNMRSYRKKWLCNLLHCFETIILWGYNDEDQICKYNINLIKIINKYYSLFDKYYVLSMRNTRNIITHFVLLNITKHFKKIGTLDMPVIFNINKREQINRKYNKIYNNVLLLYNINNTDYEILLSYENRNIFIELLNTCMTLFTNKLKNIDIDIIIDIDEHVFINNLQNDIPIIGLFRFIDIFRHYIERFIYFLIEKEYYTIANVYIKDILEFDSACWLQIAKLFTKPMFFKVFIKYICDNRYTEDDIDDKQIDPLSFTLISEPICLPNNIIMDKYTIYRHLLLNKYNPFTRDHLNVAILEEYNTTETAISMMHEYEQY
jgi:hypothetical protein